MNPLSSPLMACVSKPMRTKDFPDTLFQYSSLKQLSKRRLYMHLPPHPSKHHKLVSIFFHLSFFLSFCSLSFPQKRCSNRYLCIYKTAYMFCYPKQKTARERTSGRESRAEPGSRNNDMPSTQSHLGLPTRNIIQKKIKYKFASDVVLLPYCLSVSNRVPPYFVVSLQRPWSVHEEESEPFPSTIHVEMKNTSLSVRIFRSPVFSASAPCPFLRDPRRKRGGREARRKRDAAWRRNHAA